MMGNINEVLEIKFVNFTYSEAIEDYILKRISKHENEASLINLLKVQVSSVSNNSHKNYQICIEVDMKNSGFIIKKTGPDIYSLIDEISDAFRKKLVKFLDQYTDHSKTPISELIKDEETADTVKDPEELYQQFRDIDPSKYQIIEQKSFKDHTPLHIEEAIDLMEMIKRPCLLFKNIDTGTYSVVYKVTEGDRDGYGLINSKV